LIETFNRIKKHEFGKYLFWGTMIMGEYVTWPEGKRYNFQAIKDLMDKLVLS
jgi:hypothetical protein